MGVFAKLAAGLVRPVDDTAFNAAVQAFAEEGLRPDQFTLVELPADYGASVFGEINKAARARKYIKRIPTGNPKRPWRYFYAVQHGKGIGHHEHMVPGAAFRHGEGHYEITHATPEAVKIRHTHTGHEAEMTREELGHMLREHHAAAIQAHAERQAMPAAIRRQITPAAQEARRQELLDAGYELLIRKDKANRDVAKWVNPATAAWHRENQTTHWAQAETAQRQVDESRHLDASQGGGLFGEKASTNRREREERAEGFGGAGGGEGNGEESGGLPPSMPPKPEPEPEPLPEPEPVKIVPLNQYKTAENRPPNFLGLNPERFGLKSYRTSQGWTNYQQPSRVDMPAHPYRLEDLTDAQLLQHLSLFAAPPDGPLAPGFQTEFFLSQLGRGADYSGMSQKQKLLYGPIARNLAGWWTNLNDDERQAFWDRFVNNDKQFTLGRVSKPEHENADFPIPAGMEKLKAKGYDFHEYQKKAANFTIDHAPRAIMAMEMGLGKTLTAYGVFHELKNRGEVTQMLVTAPLSAHGSWADHARDFSDARVQVLTGATAKKRQEAYNAFKRGDVDVLVISPDTPAKDWKRLEPEGLPSLPVGSTVRLTKKYGEPDQFTKAENGMWTNEYGDEVTAESIIEQHREAANAAALSSRYGAKQKPGGALEYMPESSDFVQIRNIVTEKGNKLLRVADEVHKFKNPESARSEGFVEAIAKPEGRVIGMTGTPKPNGAEDFYHVVNAIAPGALGKDFDQFADRYTYQGTAPTGQKMVMGFRPDQLGELYNDASSVFFARTTADPDVVIHLPSRIDLAPAIPPDDTQQKIMARMIYWMEQRQKLRMLEAAANRDPKFAMAAASMREHYEEAKSDSNPDPIDRLSARAAPADERVALLRWQQLAISPSLLDSGDYERHFGDDFPNYESPKLANIADATVEHLTQHPDKGAVVFSEYNGGIQAMKKALIKRGIKDAEIGIYTGATSPTKRRELQDALNSGAIKVLIGNTAALETGANLQKRANFVAHLNTPWAPDRLTQSTARVYRQGQEAPVIVYRPTGSHVEELIERTVSRKLLEASQATGRTMQADDAIAASMRKPGKIGLDRDTIASVLGVDPSVFAEAGKRAESPEEVAARLEREGSKSYL